MSNAIALTTIVILSAVGGPMPDPNPWAAELVRQLEQVYDWGVPPLRTTPWGESNCPSEFKSEVVRQLVHWLDQTDDTRGAGIVVKFYFTTEFASRKMKEYLAYCGEDAAPHLLFYAASSDAETAAKASEILAEISDGVDQKALETALKHWKYRRKIPKTDRFREEATQRIEELSGMYAGGVGPVSGGMCIAYGIQEELVELNDPRAIPVLAKYQCTLSYGRHLIVGRFLVDNGYHSPP